MRLGILVCLSACTVAIPPVEPDVHTDTPELPGPNQGTSAPLRDARLNGYPSGDTDTDVDSDTDSDTDTDTDTRPLEDAVGTMTWTTWRDGEQTCQATLSVLGMKGRGCSTCELLLDVETEVTEQSGDCDLDQPDLFAGGRLGHADRWRDPWRDQLFHQVLLSGDAEDDWRVLSRSGDRRGGTSRSTTRFSWWTDREWGALDRLPDRYDACSSAVGKRAGTLVTGPTTASEDVPCDGSQVDAWTVTLSAAASISIDTADPTRTFDPYLWVNNDDDCTVYESDDAFACTNPPPSFGCPALTLPAGTWTVFVGSRGECLTGASPYEIAVSGSGSSLSLAADDETTGGVTVHRIEVSGSLNLY